ncbi:MAG: diphosphomevalonate decarboxylase [Ardenticatenales bacterium]|jgi:diphosphomevalonate decarboxylase|nr:diphosphomevalonate decarboxylase [Ardenticatenales bacterium]
MSHFAPSHPAATATARAPSNIAFVKYWGNLDDATRLPFNDSISMNLSAAHTTTTVTFDTALHTDTLTIDGRAYDPQHAADAVAITRVTHHLDSLRALADTTDRAAVVSVNSFPMGTGIASSASAFAALSVAAAAALGLELDERTLSTIARRGSGSAARSVPEGFVRWYAAATDEGSYAASIAPATHWDLHDVVAIVSRAHKAVGSGGGHALAASSPLFAERIARLPARLAAVEAAIAARDVAALGDQIEAEALELHAVAMTSRPAVLYWDGATVELLHRVRRWRADGLAVWFTLDAGPNVHLICEGHVAPAVAAELANQSYVESSMDNSPAAGARVIGPGEDRGPSAGHA